MTSEKNNPNQDTCCFVLVEDLESRLNGRRRRHHSVCFFLLKDSLNSWLKPKQIHFGGNFCLWTVDWTLSLNQWISILLVSFFAEKNPWIRNQCRCFWPVKIWLLAHRGTEGRYCWIFKMSIWVYHGLSKIGSKMPQWRTNAAMKLNEPCLFNSSVDA